MWNLKTFKEDYGRCVWEFIENADENLIREQNKIFSDYDVNQKRNSGDKILRHLILHKNKNNHSVLEDSKELNPINNKNEGVLIDKKALEASTKGIEFYQNLQNEQGFWAGDYGGPMFLLPNFVILMYVTKSSICPNRKKQILRYIKNHQNSDGGWGLHIQSETSTMFGSVMNYVAVRLLGSPKNKKWVLKAREFIKQHGGTFQNAPWGKFWLCVLGIYDWKGINSVFPEIWMLSEYVPFHPSRWWCHCRMVYLPMAYIYANKITYEGENDNIIRDLRKEIYNEEYGRIKWEKHKTEISKLDQFYNAPNSFILRGCFKMADLYEKCYFQWFRKKTIEFLLDYIKAEDSRTDFICLGPVNKTLNALCVWHSDGKDSKLFKKHLERILDFLWIAEDGMKMQGENGSQIWDTTLAAIAISHSPERLKFSESLKKAYSFLEKSQLSGNVAEKHRFYRHSSKGGWPFSTKAQGYPVSDCTSHALYSVLLLHEIKAIPEESRIPYGRLKEAVDLILSLQNSDGGFPTYEKQRGSFFLEYMNPSVVFENIMVDYSNVELSSSAIMALSKFNELHPTYRNAEIKMAIKNSAEYIKKEMREDGSWYGSWGICFTYASFFALKALALADEKIYANCIKKGCEFLLKKQKDDGGWGESYESCTKKNYCQNKTSQIVNTSWALIALMEADFRDLTPIRKGINFLVERQDENGDWPQEDISGVFNGNCMITYTSYRNVFPIWALSLFSVKYKDMFYFFNW